MARRNAQQSVAVSRDPSERASAVQPSLFTPAEPHVLRLLPRKGSLLRPMYTTDLGMALCGDSLAILKKLPAASVDLVVTSPPYALHYKKEYGNVDKEGYVGWLLPFAREIRRVLKEDGSFVLNIGGSVTTHPSAAA
jgi:site-specific DNA-methyltransferase (cytosine-N4-specific)